MARIPNCKALLLPITILAIVLGSTFASVAFADDQDGKYSHSHVTASWNHGLVCGDHRCASGEMPHNPPIVPVRGSH